MGITQQPDGIMLDQNEYVVWSGNGSFFSFFSSTKTKRITIFILILLLSSVGLSFFYTDSFARICCGGICGGPIALIILGIILVARRPQYKITNRNVYASKGIIDRTTDKMPLEKVINVTYSQGFLGSVLGFGDLQFESLGGTRKDVVFNGIKKEEMVKQLYEQAKRQPRNRSRSKRGSRQPPPRPSRPSYNKNLPPPEPKKTCDHCGTKIDADSKYCKNCGEKV
ncbi:MAG: PH domain-containing protein [Candidatus Thermoplasmatota archaeon]